MDERDRALLKASFEVARNARDRGNHPFGALLADEYGRVLLEAENTVVTENDATGHAEMNLMREASAKFESEFLGRCTIFTSTEPCAMCSGAIFWANVGRIVYGLGAEGLYEFIGEGSRGSLRWPCRDIFARGDKPIEIIGPMLEEEALDVHLDFWNANA